jgi:hypothetical protein
MVEAFCEPFTFCRLACLGHQLKDYRPSMAWIVINTGDSGGDNSDGCLMVGPLFLVLVVGGVGGYYLAALCCNILSANGLLWEEWLGGYFGLILACVVFPLVGMYFIGRNLLVGIIIFSLIVFGFISLIILNKFGFVSTSECNAIFEFLEKWLN